MQHREIEIVHDLNNDFRWGLSHKWDDENLKCRISAISKLFSFDVDWDEGVENWIALLGTDKNDFILISSIIPFAFVHVSLMAKLQYYADWKVCFFENYHSDRIFIEKDIINLLFNIPEGYFNFEKKYTISDFIYKTYT